MGDGRRRCCCGGSCCCTVRRQVRAYNPSTGTWLCTYTTGYVINRQTGSTLLAWDGQPFEACSGDALLISGFPEFVLCAESQYPFRWAHALVYCDGELIDTESIYDDHTQTLRYDGLLDACPCAAHGGECEILIDIAYVPEFNAGNEFRAYSRTVSAPSGVCIAVPILQFNELRGIASVPLKAGSTYSNLFTPSHGGGGHLAPGAVGKPFTVWIPPRYFVSLTPTVQPVFVCSRWQRSAPAYQCVVNSSTSHTWTVATDADMSANAQYTHDDAPCGCEELC